MTAHQRNRHRKRGRTTQQLKEIAGTNKIFIVHTDAMKAYCLQLNPLIRRQQIVVLKEDIVKKTMGMTLDNIVVDHAVYQCADETALNALALVFKMLN